MCCPNWQPPGLSAPRTDPRRRYLIKMEPRWKKKISEFLEMIPPLRGGDFQGIAGLSSDASLLVGVNSARAKFYEGPRAAQHRLDEPGQIIPQHGCVPAWPASVSPGSGNFSRKTKVVRGSSEPSVCHLRYQHASEIGTDLQRLKRDTESGRQAASAPAGMATAIQSTAQPSQTTSSAVIAAAK